MKIKEGFSENLGLEHKIVEDEEEKYVSYEERKKIEFERRFNENMKVNVEKEINNFEDMNNVFSSLQKSKNKEKKYKIEKDDLLGWDL